MIVVVTGGRDFNDRTAVFSALGILHKQFPITELIEGGEIAWELDDGSRMVLKAEKQTEVQPS